MVVCESLLLLTFLVFGIYVIYTDIKTGVVRNIAVQYALVTGIVINIIYYCFFARPFLELFLKNLLIIIVISGFLFFKHFWGGGDSKLFICLTILIPGRLYDADESVPGLICLIIIFLIAYFYVFIDSIRGLVKREHFTKGHGIPLSDVPNMLRDYLVIYMLLRLISILGIAMFPDFYQKNAMLIMFVNLMIIIGLADIKLLKSRWLMIILLFLTGISLLFIQTRNVQNWIDIVKSALVVALALLLRYFASGYNYLEIKTSEVKKGMIPSFATVLLFNKSRIKNLPISTTEDMGDRITELQAEAIRRWGMSKNGKETIVIVKKVPFAIFLVFGTFLFVLLRVTL